MIKTVYECEKCGHEQQPVFKTDWRCSRCGKVERTLNDKPKGWCALRDERGGTVAFCDNCRYILNV